MKNRHRRGNDRETQRSSISRTPVRNRERHYFLSNHRLLTAIPKEVAWRAAFWIILHPDNIWCCRCKSWFGSHFGLSCCLPLLLSLLGVRMWVQVESFQPNLKLWDAVSGIWELNGCFSLIWVMGVRECVYVYIWEEEEDPPWELRKCRTASIGLRLSNL